MVSQVVVAGVIQGACGHTNGLLALGAPHALVAILVLPYIGRDVPDAVVATWTNHGLFAHRPIRQYSGHFQTSLVVGRNQTRLLAVDLRILPDKGLALNLKQT
jgi:hypothetical protein